MSVGWFMIWLIIVRVKLGLEIKYSVTAPFANSTLSLVSLWGEQLKIKQHINKWRHWALCHEQHTLLHIRAHFGWFDDLRTVNGTHQGPHKIIWACQLRVVLIHLKIWTLLVRNTKLLYNVYYTWRDIKYIKYIIKNAG